MQGDRRRFRRIARCFNVRFAIGGSAGSQFMRDGVTKDISAGGMYFTTHDRTGLEVGRKLALRIYVPCAAQMVQHELIARTDGRVVRVTDSQQGGSRQGAEVGVQFERPPNLDFETLGAQRLKRRGRW